MQNLSNNPVPQWKIKYDSQFNLPPLKNTTGGDIEPENSGGKIPWLGFIIVGLIIIGSVTASCKSQQQTNDKS
jgi:hypothetical protein